MKKRTRKKKSVYTHQTHTPQHGIFFFPLNVACAPRTHCKTALHCAFAVRLLFPYSFIIIVITVFFGWLFFVFWVFRLVFVHCFVYPPPTAVLYSYTINLPMLRFANKKKNWDCLLKEKNGKKKKGTRNVCEEWMFWEYMGEQT